MIGNVADLRERVHEIGAEQPDPSRVTEKLLAELTESELVVAARAALQDYVRHLLVRPPVTGRKAPPPSGPDAARYRTADGQATASPKVAAQLDWYAAELCTPFCTAAGWKHLRACSTDDVWSLVSARRRKAADVTAEADRFERLAEAMTTHAVATVADLPEQIGRTALAR